MESILCPDSEHPRPRAFVQDGHFVPNLTIGHPVVASLRQHTQAFLDCHLMVSNPGQWVEKFAKAGADMYTFHLEALAGPSPKGEAPEVRQTITMYKNVLLMYNCMAERL